MGAASKRRWMVRSAGTLAHGVALLPSQIETATGTWKLLAVPTLLGHAPSNGTDARARQFESYAGRTAFTPVGKQAADALLAEWKDADGDYQSDVSFEDVSKLDRQDLLTEQHTVAPGDNVCVIGRFSAARGGIVPSSQPTRLIVGDAAQLAEKLRREVITRTLIALLLLAALVVAAVLAQQRPTARATTVSFVTLSAAQA